MRNWRKMWIIEFFIETIVKDSELISLPFTAGEDFTDLTYTIQRERKQADDIAILHYDNLYDFANTLIGKTTY